MKKGIVFETMRRLAQRLDAEGIPYAVIGGMALAALMYSLMEGSTEFNTDPPGITKTRFAQAIEHYLAHDHERRQLAATANRTVFTTASYPLQLADLLRSLD